MRRRLLTTDADSRTRCAVPAAALCAVLALGVALATGGCAAPAPVGTAGAGADPFTQLVQQQGAALEELSAPVVTQAGYSTIGSAPSNDRDWVPEHEKLAHAELRGNKLLVHNVRNAEFFSYRDCLVDYEDRTYDLSKLRTVDFLMVPFNESKALAHTMLSFGFDDGQYLGVSVEVRLEKGESYDAAIGLMNQFELIYVVADERDLIRVRTEYRDVDVLVYRTKATPDDARRLLVDVMRRVNKLKQEPEWYDTLSNNCTTNIVRHINTLAPGSVPTDYRVLLPGFADSLAYELGLIDNSRPFAEVRRRARVNDLALRYRDDPHFSQRIRGERVAGVPAASTLAKGPVVPAAYFGPPPGAPGAAGSPCDPRRSPGWYVRGEALYLTRDNHALNRELVESDTLGDPLLFQQELNFDWAIGPSVLIGRRFSELWSGEASYFGTHEFHASRSVVGINDLDLPGAITTIADDFNNANEMTFTYDSTLHNAELNLVRDFPWLAVLGGFRYLRWDEEFNIHALDQDGDASDYLVETTNNLYGGQLGLRFTNGGPRFGWELTGKAGIFANDATQTQLLRDDDNAIVVRNASSRTTETAYVGDLNGSLYYHLTRFIRVRGGYNVLWIDGLALAPDQLDFTAATTAQAVRGDGQVFLHGANFGLEAVW
jgi:hypothetical protein